MSYDPKLRQAMAEIESICSRYDIGGYVGLVSRDHGEFRAVIPKWVLIKNIIDENKTVIGLDFKIRRALPAESAQTAGFICSGREMMAGAFRFFDHAFNELRKHMTVEHKIWGQEMSPDDLAKYKPN